MSTAPATRSRPILFQRDFGRYWFAATAATSGMWMWRVTSPVVMYELTGSPLMLGLLSVASYGPILAFSFVGGVLADRFPRRRLISIAHGAIASLLLGMAAMAAADRLTPGLVFGAAVLEGTMFALTKPALQALVTELVAPAQVPRAVAVNTVHFSISQLIGPALASGTLLVGGHELGLLTAGLLYAPLIGMMFFVRVHHSVGDTRSDERGLALFRSGLRMLRTATIAPLLLTIALGSIALEGAVRVLAPRFATVLDHDESAAGLIISSQALGSALAVFVVGRAERARASLTYAQSGYAFMAVAIVMYALAPTFGVALAIAVFVGGSQTVGFSIATGMIHGSTPSAVRGRVMAFHAMALLGVRPLAGVIAGVLASNLTTRVASASFCVAALGAVAMFRGVAGARRAPADVGRTDESVSASAHS